nr:hypothetical protein [Fusobacterium varium]
MISVHGLCHTHALLLLFTGVSLTIAIRRQMIKGTDGDSFEKLRSLNQDLTFNYADMIFEKADINFSDIRKKTLGIIGEDNLYPNLGLLLSDQYLKQEV